MDGLNQSNQAKQSTPDLPTDYNKQSSQVSERQAKDFAERMSKEDKEKKNKSNEEKDQSLEGLLAERSKAQRGKVSERQEQDGQHQGQTGGGLTQLKTDAQIKEMQQINSVKEIDELLQKLADKIQVSAKDALNGAEIRITMKENIIAGTEIRIQRLSGELTVTMNTTSAEAGNFLAQHEASLQKTLAERFSNEKVQVNINMSNDDNQDNNGRSRNQYASESDDQNDQSQNRRA